MNGHELAAHFIATARWEELPAAVQRKARMCLADNLGATLAGTLTRVSRIAADYAAAAWPGDEATILSLDGEGRLSGRRAGAAGAAFANGCAANGIDSDDSARYSYGHAGAQVFPTALAVAEGRGLSGARLLCGMVVGYEVAHRTGRCWHDHHDVYQACGSWGSVACAATAAHLMDLPPEQAGHALGIADYHAPNLPMMRDVAHPAMVKHGIGWGAFTGITAAGLAAAGFTGIPSLLAFPEYQEWTSDFGELIGAGLPEESHDLEAPGETRPYIMVDGVAWKAKGYACCGWAHAAVEGAARLFHSQRVKLVDIARIRIETFHEAAALGARLPTTTEEAQFNLAWPVAAMLVDGEIGPRQTLEDRLSDPVIRALAERVEIVESEELNRLCRLYEKGDPAGRFASEVTLVLKNGAEIGSGLVGGGLSFPQPGWDERVMKEKFRWLAGFVLDKPRIDRLVEMVWRFETVADVRQLSAMIATA